MVQVLAVKKTYPGVTRTGLLEVGWPCRYKGWRCVGFPFVRRTAQNIHIAEMIGKDDFRASEFIGNAWKLVSHGRQTVVIFLHVKLNSYANLRQIGVAIQLYVQENNNRLPSMADQFPGVTNEFAGPEIVLSNHLGNVNVLRCPSDKWKSDTPPPLVTAGPTYFEQTGSSYSWVSLLNGQDLDHLKL